MQIVCFRWLRSATNFNKLKFHYQIYIYTYNFLIKLISVNFYYQIWSKNFIIKKINIKLKQQTAQNKKKQTKNKQKTTVDAHFGNKGFDPKMCVDFAPWPQESSLLKCSRANGDLIMWRTKQKPPLFQL